MNFGIKGIKPPKIKKLRFETAGDRTLKESEKKRLKEEADYKCQKCGKKKSLNHLEIHHKREIYKVKRKAGLMGKLGKPVFGKRKLPHDRKNNLMVLCLECHANMRKKK